MADQATCTDNGTPTSATIATTSKTKLTEFKVGDHVFTWKSYLGIPFSYQQHGIVIEVNVTISEKSKDGRSETEIVILNFDHHKEVEEEEKEKKKQASTEEDTEEDTTTTPTKNGTTTTNTTRVCTPTPQCFTQKQASNPPTLWEHVQYQQTHWHKRLSLRAGTCTPNKSDHVPLILHRINFLQHNNQNLLSSLPYDAHKRNGECIATWITTGVYQSDAGSAKMGQAGLHIGTFTLAGGIAAQLAVSVVVPVLLPFMAAMDVGQAVIQGRDLMASRNEWSQRTEEWNLLFEEYLKTKVMMVANNKNMEIKGE